MHRTIDLFALVLVILELYLLQTQALKILGVRQARRQSPLRNVFVPGNNVYPVGTVQHLLFERVTCLRMILNTVPVPLTLKVRTVQINAC